MVGLALVSAIAVFGASLSRSATSSVDNAISADLIVTRAQNAQGGFSNRGGPDRGIRPRRHGILDRLPGPVRTEGVAGEPHGCLDA